MEFPSAWSWVETACARFCKPMSRRAQLGQDLICTHVEDSSEVGKRYIYEGASSFATICLSMPSSHHPSLLGWCLCGGHTYLGRDCFTNKLCGAPLRTRGCVQNTWFDIQSLNFKTNYLLRIIVTVFKFTKFHVFMVILFTEIFS